MKFYRNLKALCFASGVAATVVGGKILKNPKTREACVKGMAKGMKLHQDARVAFQNMKESAEDLCSEARKQAEGASAGE